MVPADVLSEMLTLPAFEVNAAALDTEVAADRVMLPVAWIAPAVVNAPVVSVAVNMWLVPSASMALKLPTLKVPELAVTVTSPDARFEFGSCTSPVIDA